MGISKVEYAGTVLIDLTSDTVSAEHLESGYTAHAKDGSEVYGTLVKKTVQASKTYSASANGSYTINPDTGNDGMAKVSLTVSIPEYDGSVT